MPEYLSVRADGTSPLPRGKLASIVTHLERLAPFPSGKVEGRLRRWVRPSCEGYRALYRAVGERWLWFSRLELSDVALSAILTDPKVHVFEWLGDDGQVVGLVELDFRTPTECELAFFGLLPGAIGKGLGASAMEEVFALAAEAFVSRLWVHTCTQDHPSALAFYRRVGFTPIGRAIEIVDDPRLRGILPREDDPRVPIL